MRTLLIDNYDSFTYNLFQLLAEVNGEEPIVVHNDAAGWEELACLRFDNVVLSPGPGRPERVGDFGVCAEAIHRSEAPLLGICLGHQGLAWAHGGDVAHAPEPMHGRISAVVHDGSPLFAGIPREFRAVRYHSLCVGQPLPGDLEPIAWTGDGIPMGIAHRKRPQWGLQFHPESICTEHGRRLLANFRDLSVKRGGRSGGRRGRGSAEPPAKRPVRQRREPEGVQLRTRRLDRLYDAERAFVHLYAESREAFWLDSSRPGEDARFSFLGAPGPLGAKIAYDVASGQVRVRRGAVTEVFRESIFDYLSREMRRLRLRSEELPFDFNCGFAGYFGYELKADCGGSRAHRSPTPDAAFLLADRLIAFDHRERRTYLLGLANRGEEAGADRWIEETSRRLASLPPLPPAEPGPAANRASVEFRLHRSRRRYLRDVAACKRQLAEGETYEICLTNTISADVAVDPLFLYRRLRRINPAPFSAYLRLGDIAVLSSSPERFLRIGSDRRVEAKPIKGTRRRGRTGPEDARLADALRTSEKDRAENLMITDLLRNDLGSVCEIGTVHVSDLMRVETYETVHQLVSTVRGVLRAELEPPDCVRACFPAGSMTGAPKKRTMEILDRLEGEARGIYSGALGYLGLSGACDLGVVIRTIVVDRRSARIGVGGAIVTQSDPQEEYEEMLLKADAPMRAIDPEAALTEGPSGGCVDSIRAASNQRRPQLR